MDIFVARQPIFDRNRQVVAYELLYRSGRLQGVGGDPESIARKMVNNTMLGFGLDTLIGSLPGLFPASREFLCEEAYTVLPPKQAVLTIPRGVMADPVFVEACRRAVNAGYRLALAEFMPDAGHADLLPLLAFVKTSYLANSPEERAHLLQRSAGLELRVITEHVLTYPDFQGALDEGGQLFLGNFFSQPELLSEKDIVVNDLRMAQLVAEIHKDELDIEALEHLIKSEVGLSLKLLRYLNSAGLGWRHEVTTIGQALRVLGARPTRKWASLVAMTMVGDHKPRELLQTSLLRGQLCEEIGAMVLGDSRRPELFLVGLLSSLDALLDKPLPILLEQMRLGKEITATLLGDPTPLRDCLTMTIAYDQGDWATLDPIAERLGIDTTLLPVAYHRTVEWVGEVMQAA